MIPGILLNMPMTASGAASTDPYLAYVTALLHMDGANAGTTFTDFKGNTWARTNGASGAATTSTTQSKFGTASLSPGSTGSVDGIQTSSNAVFAFGTGDFTIEAWVYPTSFANVGCVYACSATSGDTGLLFEVDTSGNLLFRGTSTVYATGSGPLSLNTWSHVAASRTGTTLTLWVNGSQVATATVSKNFTDTGIPSIGSWATGSTSSALNFVGYIDDVRITNGIGRYTGGFSVPTTAFPEIESDAYYSSVSLLLHMDGTDGGTTFTDQKGHTLTAVSTTTSATQKKFGTTAMYHAATGNKITTPDAADLRFGTNDFTIEFWIYLTFLGNSSATGSFPYTKTTSGNNLTVEIVNSGLLRVWMNSSVIANCSTTLTTNTWYHVALVRSGSTVTWYLNGIASGSGTSSFNFTDTSPVGIGDYTTGGGAGSATYYLDELRVTNGVARYKGPFLVPQAAFPNS